MSITIEVLVNQSIDKVWECWTSPEHIVQWNAASEDWHTTRAENDLRVGGKFTSRMEAKDGSFGFDFEGIYEEVSHESKLVYAMEDARRVVVNFTQTEGAVKVTETFDIENMNSAEMQRTGWQAILTNFKKHAENME